MKWILIPVTIRFTAAVLGAENTSKLRCSHGGLSPANRLGFSMATKVMGKMSLKRVMTPEGRQGRTRRAGSGQECGNGDSHI